MSEDTPNTQAAGSIVPLPDAAPLPQETFADAGSMDGEPGTDVRIVLDDGLELRERIVVQAASAETVTTTAPNPAPTLVSYTVSNALLGPGGEVVLNDEGQPKIASRHELVLSAEAAGRLGTPEAVQGAVDEARRIAAAKARMEFVGMDLLSEVLGARTR